MNDIIITDFLALEASLAEIDKGAARFWVGVNERYNEAVAAMPEKDGKKVPLSVRAWSIAWQDKVKTRSAQAVQQTLSIVRAVEDKGYDLDTFVSIKHMTEVLRGKQAAPVAPAKKSAKARRLALTNTAAFKALPQADQVAIKAALGL